MALTGGQGYGREMTKARRFKLKRQEGKDKKEQTAKEMRMMDLLKLCNIRA